MRRVAALLLAAMLSGCSASQCDPNSAGFFAGIGCAVGGGYAARSQSLRTELTQSQESASAAESQAAANEAAARAADRTLAIERGELTAMQREQADLARRLAVAEAQHTATSAQLAAAKRALAALQDKTKVQAAEATPDPAAVAALKASQQRLLELMVHM